MARLAPALAAALLLAAAAPARAGGAAFGGGGGPVSVSSDALQGGGATEAGFFLFGAYRFGDRLSLELAVTGVAENLPTLETTDISYPEDRAEFSVFDLRLRFDLLPASSRRLIPWVEAGLGLVTLNWQEFFYMEQGVGLSLAAGVDVRIAAGLFLRGSIAHVSAGTGDNYDHDTPDLAATTLLLSAGWQFGWPPLPGRRATPPAPPPGPGPGDGPASAAGETPGAPSVEEP